MKPVPDPATPSSPNRDQHERLRSRRSQVRSSSGTERPLGRMEHDRDDDANVVVHRADDESGVPSVSGDGHRSPNRRDGTDRDAPVRVPVSRRAAIENLDQPEYSVRVAPGDWVRVWDGVSIRDAAGFTFSGQVLVFSGRSTPFQSTDVQHGLSRDVD